ncbi:MAG: TonB-dependent receptor [Caulobacterales bacterium]|nr:TonB-dependent receptor [Caulobacterales bacterium]
MAPLRAALLLAVSALALAPERGRAAAATPAPVDVGEVVVTAQRREERLIDVPIAITAATRAELEAQGVQNTRDLTNMTPGLNAATQGFAFQPSIRGIGTTSTALGDETNVALYVDNVYMPFQAGNAFALKNIERIEVLKGPQGTLFGRNATGGAIRVVTADPAFDPGFEASANYGFKLHSRELNAYATGPLAKGLAVGLSAYAYDDDGYVHNLAPQGGKVADTHQVTLRGKLLATPTDKLRIVLEGDYTNSVNSTGFSTTIQQGVSGSKTVAGAITPPDKSIDPYTVALTFDPYVKGLSSGGYLQVRYDLPGHTLTSVSAYRSFRLKAFLDSDRTNLDLTEFHIFQNTKVKSQEFDLASHFTGPLNYVAGLYLFDSKARAPATLNYSAPIVTIGGVRRQNGPLVNNANTQGAVDTRSWAGFGEATWAVTDALSVIGGYRYTWEKKDALARNALSGVQFTGTDKWTNSSVRLTARYRLDERSNVYVTYSTGFKSGAFNTSAVSNPLQEVQPEEVKAWEAGLKSRVGPFTILASAFDYRYDNIQLQVNNILNPVAGTTILQNAATARIRGADLQVGARLSDDFSAQLGVSWLPTAKYTSFAGGLTFIPNAGGVGATPVSVDLSGTRMIRTPKLTADLSGTYTHEVAGGKLKASAAYFWSEPFIWIPGGAVRQSGYATVNARVGWTTPDQRFTFSVWGRNLTDKVYWLQAGANSGGFSGSYAQPREIGVGVDVGF